MNTRSIFRAIVSFQVRNFSKSSLLCGKKNFRKFILPRRGTEIFKNRQKTNPDPRIPVFSYGVRSVSLRNENNVVPEKIPELVVPNLTGFELKPYVSYRATDVTQSKFTSQDLFNAVYASKIVADFKAGKLDDSGNPLEPSPEESLTAEEAKLRARQTGSDIFTPRSKREEEELYMSNV